MIYAVYIIHSDYIHLNDMHGRADGTPDSIWGAIRPAVASGCCRNAFLLWQNTSRDMQVAAATGTFADWNDGTSRCRSFQRDSQELRALRVKLCHVAAQTN
jgi:hypothetical protein